MVPQLLAAYTRTYTELPPYQRAGRVEYTLYRMNDSALQLVVQEQEGRRWTCICDLADMPPGRACDLLRFLYENAVAVQNVGDVVKDLCGL